jgi:hypothetical protein
VLKLDLDNEQTEPVYIYKNKISFSDLAVFNRLKTVQRFFRMRKITADIKPTKHGRHVTISFDSDKKITDADIVFLQLMLLSDWRRELFNWLRIRSNAKKWNVLYKQKFNSKMRLVSKEVEK